jgi:hypothetical protein
VRYAKANTSSNNPSITVACSERRRLSVPALSTWSTAVDFNRGGLLTVAIGWACVDERESNSNVESIQQQCQTNEMVQLEQQLKNSTAVHRKCLFRSMSVDFLSTTDDRSG